MITKDSMSDPDLLEEIRMALESEVKITIVQHLAEVPNLDGMMKDENAFQVNEGAVLRSSEHLQPSKESEHYAIEGGRNGGPESFGAQDAVSVT